MKNKKLTYLLLVVVALIWGAVIYQLVGSKEELELEVAQGAEFVVDAPVTKAIALELNYPDPFLKNRKWTSGIRSAAQQNTASRPAKKPLVRPKLQPVAEKQLVWPNVVFTGTVNEGALVMVNNRAYIVKDKEEAGDVQFEQITKDSIRVSYMDENKVIYKKKF